MPPRSRQESLLRDAIVKAALDCHRAKSDDDWTEASERLWATVEMLHENKISDKIYIEKKRGRPETQYVNEIIRDVKSGMLSVIEIAKKYRMHRNGVYSLLARARRDGRL